MPKKVSKTRGSSVSKNPVKKVVKKPIKKTVKKPVKKAAPKKSISTKSSRTSELSGSKTSKVLTNTASKSSTKDGRVYQVKTKTGSKVLLKKKTIEDARARRGVFQKPKPYKGSVIKDKAGNMTGYKTHDGKYTRVTNTVDRKKAAKKIAYDKKLHAHNAKNKESRNKRVSDAKRL